MTLHFTCHLRSPCVTSSHINLRKATSSYATSRYTAPRHAMARHATPRYAVPRHGTPCHATPCHATSRHPKPRHNMSCQTTPQHVTPINATPRQSAPRHATRQDMSGQARVILTESSSSTSFFILVQVLPASKERRIPMNLDPSSPQ